MSPLRSWNKSRHACVSRPRHLVAGLSRPRANQAVQAGACTGSVFRRALVSLCCALLFAGQALAVGGEAGSAPFLKLQRREAVCTFETTTPSPEERKLCETLQAGVLDAGVPAAIVAVGMPSGRVLSVAVGVACDAAVKAGTGVEAAGPDGSRNWTGEPAQPGMHSRIGSVSKLFTAVVLLRLQERGLLDLDTPVAAWLGETIYPNADRVTIRQLLQMSSGYEDYLAADSWVAAFTEAPGALVTPQELIGHARDTETPVLFAPGDGWDYSNTGYVMAGLVAEQASGRSLQELVEQELIKPLGLSGTFSPAANSLQFPAPRLCGHFFHEGRWRDYTLANPTNFFAAGDLISTARDLAVFMRALEEGRLLAAASMEELRDFVDMNGAPWDGEAPGYGLGYGYNHGATGHNGAIPGYQAALWHYGEHVFAVLLNSFPLGTAEELFWELARLYYPNAGDSDEEPWPDNDPVGQEAAQ